MSANRKLARNEFDREFGGASRDRTDDLIVANDGVCQFGPHLARVWPPITFQNVRKNKFTVCRESCLNSFSGLASHGCAARAPQPGIHKNKAPLRSSSPRHAPGVVGDAKSAHIMSPSKIRTEVRLRVPGATTPGLVFLVAFFWPTATDPALFAAF